MINFVIFKKRYLVTPSFGNPTNILASAKDADGCPPKPQPTFFGHTKLRSVGRIIGCWDYGFTDKNERFVIPSEAVDKLQLALLANLTIFMDLQEDYHDIAVYNRSYKE